MAGPPPPRPPELRTPPSRIDVPPREVIVRVAEGEAGPFGYRIIRVVGTEEQLLGAGANTRRIYICVCEEKR